MQRKARVALGVFMPAAHQRVARQGRELHQAGEHLGRRAFQQPPAAQAEQRVATEQHPAIGEIVADMAARMPGRLEHRRGRGAEIDFRPLPDLPIQLRQPMRVGLRANHRHAVARTNGVSAGDVVAVVMGQQDHVDRAALGGDRRIDGGHHGVNLGRIDDGAAPAGLVAQQPSVVVLQDGDERCFDHAPIIAPSLLYRENGFRRPRRC